MKIKKWLTLLPIFLLVTFVACGNTEEKITNIEDLASTEISFEYNQEVNEKEIVQNSEMDLVVLEETSDHSQEKTLSEVESKVSSEIGSEYNREVNDKEGIKNTSMIVLEEKESTYSQEFTIGTNLESAIVELALSFDTFDSSKTKENSYSEFFISNFCQNSRMSFDYLNQIAEENDGIITKEQIEYMQLSLTNEFIDFEHIIPEEGINSYDSSSGFNFGHIISYNAEVNEEEVNLTAEFEVGTDGSKNTKLYELSIKLVKNPESCFDGYSIKSLTSKDITPIVAGDNKEHTVEAFYLEIEENGIFTFECYGGEDDVQYDMYLEVDLSENAKLAEYVRENAGNDFNITYVLDDSMVQPICRIVPTDIKIHEEN